MNEGESCPGEDECSKDRSLPLGKYGEDADIETTCRGCKLVASKPESIPHELADHVSTAANLDRIQRIGGRFAYPDALTPIEWGCLAGLDEGRGLAEKLKRKREPKDKHKK